MADSQLNHLVVDLIPYTALLMLGDEGLVVSGRVAREDKVASVKAELLKALTAHLQQAVVSQMTALVVEYLDSKDLVLKLFSRLMAHREQVVRAAPKEADRVEVRVGTRVADHN